MFNSAASLGDCMSLSGSRLVPLIGFVMIVPFLIVMKVSGEAEMRANLGVSMRAAWVAGLIWWRRWKISLAWRLVVAWRR